MKLLDMEKVMPLIKLAIDEDLGDGDVTSELLLENKTKAKAYIVSREEIVVCGMEIIREILKLYSEKLKLKVLVDDGEHACVGKRVGIIEGPLVPMLSAERVVLNFLQRLSGIATTTQKYVRAVEGTKSNSRLAASRKIRRPLRRRTQSPPRSLRRDTYQR
jgi:nicotinate-nucleotide pyrophosphorylase (carboxylating)